MPREKRVKVYIDKHMQFWRDLRKRCNAKMDHFTKTWSIESIGNIHDTMKLLFATYFDILRKLESEHKLSLQDIYTAHSFNKASQKSVYSDIGRVKWYFIRRGVDLWYDKTPRPKYDKTTQATDKAGKTLIPIDFDKNTLDKAQASTCTTCGIMNLFFTFVKKHLECQSSAGAVAPSDFVHFQPVTIISSFT